MASTALTDEDRQRIYQLAVQGLTTREIARQLEVPGRSVGGYISHLKLSGLFPNTAPGNPGEPQGGAVGAQPAGSVVSEVAAAIKDGVQLGRETAGPPQGTGDPIETATKAIETGIDLATRGSDNGNGKADGQLLQFLTTVVTQQREAHTHVMEQIQSRHDNDVVRIEKDHDLRMGELKLKIEAERNREQDYWTRIETTRQEADKQRAELEKESRKLMGDKLDTVNDRITQNLEHANKLIEQREKASDRYIEMSERFSGEVAELRKELGKEDGTQELIKHAVERLGEPIIRAIEKRAGDNSGPAPRGVVEKKTQTGGAKMGFGGNVKNAVKNALVKQFLPYIKEGLEQARKHLDKWPKVSMKVLVDLLWSWRMYSDVSAWIQTAITFIVLNELDEVVKKAGEYITSDFRKLLATEKAKEWWTALQDAVNERVNEEEKAAKAYQAAYADKEGKEQPE